MARQDMKTSDKDTTNESDQTGYEDVRQGLGRRTRMARQDMKTSDKDSTNESGQTGYEDVRQGLDEREWPDRI